MTVVTLTIVMNHIYKTISNRYGWGRGIIYFSWLGWRDSTYLRQARNFSIGNLVAVGRLPCELPSGNSHPDPFWSGVRTLSQTMQKDHPNGRSFCMAGEEGFEPPILGPEPSALPLGHSPSSKCN
jgi:hypothetical protein